MKQDYRERPSAVPWPPLIYCMALLIAWSLETVDRFQQLDMIFDRLPPWVGLSVFGLGLMLSLWASTRLLMAKTGLMSTARALNLVEKGPYRFSRNPIYLGNTLAMIGLALALRWGWLLLLVPVAFTAITWLAVSREEAHLESRFGAAWRAYADKVRRWI